MRRPKPPSLLIASWLFIAGGFLTLAKDLLLLTRQGVMSTDFLIVLFPLGIGLLRGSEWCRKGSLLVLATLVLCQVVVVGLMVGHHTPYAEPKEGTVTVTTYQVQTAFSGALSISRFQFVGLQLLSFALLLWLAWTLTRPRVRAAFLPEPVSS